ncbi:GntR family transcriptional regulator [Bryocella elongata]|nr:GntR family transcriptional regulator [Bryocella elongata]
MKRRSQSGKPKSLSVRDRAYQYIQRAIADGVLEAGSGVSELSLAKELGSSRTPIREAMNQLAAEGLLRPGANGGMVVAQIQRDDIVELYELREALEVYSVGKVAKIPLRPADKDRLQFMIDEIGRLREELAKSGARELDREQMKRFLGCDLGFHALLVSLTGNTRIQKMINETRLLIRIFAIQRSGHDASQLESIQKYHQRILDCVDSQDAPGAMQALAEHIQVSQRERINDFDHWNREMAMRENMPGIFDLQRMALGDIS